MTAERKNLSQPADLWQAAEAAAKDPQDGKGDQP